MGAIRRLIGSDSTILVATLLIIGSSLLLLATAIVRPEGGVDASFAHRQIAFAIIGALIMFGVARTPLGFWQQWWPYLLGGSVVSLVVVRLIGVTVNGARSWIDFGPISLQPSEFGKVAVIIAGASFFAARSRELKSVKTFVLGLGLFAIPGLMIFVQPDFGTSQIYFYLAIGMAFFAGARWLHLAVVGGGALIAIVLVLGVLPAVGVHVLHEYQIKRLTGFLDPEADAQGTNYQTIQAKVAIGSGQLTGRPGGEASQVQRGFLPEPQTDFIFATLVERYGFVGGAAVLGLYLWLISRVLAVVGAATTQFGRLIAGGVAMLLFSQLIVNVGMVIGLLPVTGVPMPLFSYGGSSLWTNMAALGLVLAVQREVASPGARYTRRTGRPVGGFGSMRTGAGGNGVGTATVGGENGRRTTSLGREVAGSPLVGGAARRPRRRRPSRG